MCRLRAVMHAEGLAAPCAGSDHAASQTGSRNVVDAAVSRTVPSSYTLIVGDLQQRRGVMHLRIHGKGGKISSYQMASDIFLRQCGNDDAAK